MNKIIFSLLLIAWCLPLTIFAGKDLYVFADAKLTHRFAHLTQNIRCVVCQNQNLADSNAPVANDLRAKIYQLILKDYSDAEIENFLVERYGKFILLKPQFDKTTYLLWLFPLFACGALACLILRLSR